MNQPRDQEFAEFFKQRYGELVTFLAGWGTCLSDAEDAAQAVFARMQARWPEVKQPRAYLYRAGRNEIAASARRQRDDLTMNLRWASRSELLTHEDIWQQDEAGIVRDSLTVLPPRQRDVIARVYAGYSISEIASMSGKPSVTVRSNLRHARNTLRSLYCGDWQDLPEKAGQRLYEAWQRGERLPIPLRPLIEWAWGRAKELKIQPERGPAVEPLGRDEVKHRRQKFPLTVRSRVLDLLIDLGKGAGQMMVVTDADGVVLWRGGDRRVQGRADQVGFVEGARWDLKNAGANGIALALVLGRTVKVCGWEHYIQAQHGLSCVAAPVRDPRDRRVLAVLNLTATGPSIPHATLRAIDTIAAQLHRQLRTMSTSEASPELAAHDDSTETM